jgi:hypothetical protein
MRDREIDGKLQVTAAVSLLEFSRLVQWDAVSTEFTAVPPEPFESYWSAIDPVFGRLICWINFSAGAEFLAKGVCLLRDVEICQPKGETRNFGTLGDLWNGKVAALKRLCDAIKAEPNQQKSLVAAYKELGSAIRNRDAHAYVPNVRNANFHLVSDRFVPCFNLLVSWLPKGPHTLNRLKDDAQQFIASLV